MLVTGRSRNKPGSATIRQVGTNKAGRNEVRDRSGQQLVANEVLD